MFAYLLTGHTLSLTHSLPHKRSSESNKPLILVYDIVNVTLGLTFQSSKHSFHDMSYHTRLIRSLAMSIFLYACETWTITHKHTRLMRSLAMSIFKYSCEMWTITAGIERRMQALEISPRYFVQRSHNQGRSKSQN